MSESGPQTNAERQKAYRERKRNGVTPVTERNAESVTALRKRVTELEEEVARLKRELALAHAHPAVPLSSYLVPLEARSVRGKAVIAGHSTRCMCIGCRAGRAS